MDFSAVDTPTTYIDIKYINMISGRLDQFKHKGEFLWNFRCPICGDSKKNKSKARGYFYRKDSTIKFKCHNCHRNWKFSYFLMMFDRPLFDQYRLEIFADQTPPEKDSFADQRTSIRERLLNIQAQTQNPQSTIGIDLPSIRSLQDGHTAKKYIQQRKIPQKHWDIIYYADDFRVFCDKTFPDHGKKLNRNDPRIVLPFYNRQGVLQGVQSRGLLESSLRYLLIKADPGFEKLYGSDRIDFTKTICVVEGPFDSLFLDNCVATMDTNLMSAATILGEQYDYVFVFDNQPRNKDVCRQVRRAVFSGRKVCIWPNSLDKKDVNDMVLAGIDVQSTIYTHTFEGLKAQLQFEMWRKDQ